MNLTATHINYLIVCRRKLWLFANGITMEHTSDTVYDGKLLHEASYPQRSERYEEVLVSSQWGGVSLWGQIDYFDARNSIIHETKRSDKMEDAHVWQTKFYIWLLEINGVENAIGLLEYPKLRRTEEVLLSDNDREHLKKMIIDIKKLIEIEDCPPNINTKLCRNCSYFDFCYSSEPLATV